MTTMGWVFLVVTWSLLTYYTVWTFYKILGEPLKKDEESPKAGSRS